MSDSGGDDDNEDNQIQYGDDDDNQDDDVGDDENQQDDNGDGDDGDDDGGDDNIIKTKMDEYKDEAEERIKEAFDAENVFDTVIGAAAGGDNADDQDAKGTKKRNAKKNSKNSRTTNNTKQSNKGSKSKQLKTSSKSAPLASNSVSRGTLPPNDNIDSPLSIPYSPPNGPNDPLSSDAKAYHLSRHNTNVFDLATDVYIPDEDPNKKKKPLHEINWKILILLIPATLLVILYNILQYTKDYPFLMILLIIYGIIGIISCLTIIILGLLSKEPGREAARRAHAAHAAHAARAHIENDTDRTTELSASSKSTRQLFAEVDSVMDEDDNDDDKKRKGTMLYGTSNNMFGPNDTKNCLCCPKRNICGCDIKNKMQCLIYYITNKFDKHFYEQHPDLSPFVLDTKKYLFLGVIVLLLYGFIEFLIKIIVSYDYDGGWDCNDLIADLVGSNDDDDNNNGNDNSNFSSTSTTESPDEFEWSQGEINACVISKSSYSTTYAFALCFAMTGFIVNKTDYLEITLVKNKRRILQNPKYGDFAKWIDYQIVKKINGWRRDYFAICSNKSIPTWLFFSFAALIFHLLVAEARLGIFRNNPDKIDTSAKIVCYIYYIIDSFMLGLFGFSILCTARHFRFPYLIMRQIKLNYAQLTRAFGHGKNESAYCKGLLGWWELRKFYLNGIIKHYTNDFSLFIGAKLIGAVIGAVFTLVLLYQDDIRKGYMFLLMSIFLVCISILEASHSVAYINAQKSHQLMLNDMKIVFANNAYGTDVNINDVKSPKNSKTKTKVTSKNFGELVELIGVDVKNVECLSVFGVKINDNFMIILKGLVTTYAASIAASVFSGLSL